MADHLAIGVAADFPDRISEISAEQLEKWGIGFEEALEVGRENLWKRSVGKWQPIAEGVWMSPGRTTWTSIASPFRRFFASSLSMEIPWPSPRTAIT